MKSWIGTTILVAILVVTGFGFMAMNGHSTGAGCVASMVNGGRVPCPQADILGFIESHMSVFRAIIGAVGDMVVVVFIVTMLMALTAMVASLLLPQIPVLALEPIFPSPHTNPQRLLAWLALHEKRDPAHK